MLRITKEQVLEFSRFAVFDFEGRVRTHLREKHRSRAEMLTENEIDNLIHLALVRGPAYGMVSEHAIARLAELYFIYGKEVDEGNDVKEFLWHQALDPDTKIDLVIGMLDA